MNSEIDYRIKSMKKLQKELLAVEEDRVAGITGCTIDELDMYLNTMILD